MFRVDATYSPDIESNVLRGRDRVITRPEGETESLAAPQPLADPHQPYRCYLSRMIPTTRIQRVDVLEKSQLFRVNYVPCTIFIVVYVLFRRDGLVNPGGNLQETADERNQRDAIVQTILSRKLFT